MMKAKEKREKAALKLNIHKTKIMASSPITVHGDSSHEIKRRLLLGRKAMTNPDSILKSRDYFADKGPSGQSPMYVQKMFAAPVLRFYCTFTKACHAESMDAHHSTSCLSLQRQDTRELKSARLTRTGPLF